MTVVAVLVPVLRRPHRVRPLLDSLAAATRQPYRAVFICDPDDHEERDAVDQAGADRLDVAGTYAVKINAGVRATRAPLLMFGADDLAFHPGWLPAAQRLMSPTVGVVGTQDLCNPRVIRGEHATHCLVARWYTRLGSIDNPRQVLHEGYVHEFVDDEFVATARHRGAFAFAHDSIVEHLHPDAGKAPMDELYAARRPRMRAGRDVFRHRQHLWA